MNKDKILVTSPLLPDLDEFNEMLKEIWNSKWITNNGSFHKRLESALCEYLKVPYISLFTNGTLPLLTALQALRISGEVITTPYSFVATTHSLWWNGIKPVFVDIDPATGDVITERVPTTGTSTASNSSQTTTRSTSGNNNKSGQRQPAKKKKIQTGVNWNKKK